MSGDEGAYAQFKKWNGIDVPPSVHDALEAPWRGQTKPRLDGPASKLVLAYWNDEPKLDPQQTMTGGGGASPTFTRESCVFTVLTLKADPELKAKVLKFNAINPTKLLTPILKSEKVSDEEKQTLCKKLSNNEAKEWLAAFGKRQGDDVKASPQVNAEALAEEVAKIDAEHAARDRETALSRRAYQTLSGAQCEAMMYAVAVFFFVCRIPFAVVQHWAFVAMIQALSPAFSNYLKKRHCLANTWLPKLYHDTQEKAEARLAKAPGKKTIIIDGFKDRRGRHVMNTTVAKVGIVVYKRTAWFGKERHSGAVYGKEVEDIMAEEGEDTVLAACADNTSSNTGMLTGLFGYLSRLPNILFLLGCCVHCMDLLSEDIAKLPAFVAVLDDFKFIIKFILRYSMLHETFLYHQKKRREEDSTASMLGLKCFPDTRFAYAFLMIYSAVVNWLVVSKLTETPEYKLLKRHASDRQAPHFVRFENLAESTPTKRKGVAAVMVLKPVSKALHYLEGDSVPPSHVLPVYVLLHHVASNPPTEVSAVMDAPTVTSLRKCIEVRWTGNGNGRKVGIRNDLHCLAYALDPYTRGVVKYALGDSVFRAIEASFPEASVHAALKHYCGTDNTKYVALLTELGSYNAERDGYATKLSAAGACVKLKVAEVIATLDAETKDSHMLLLLTLLKHHSIGRSVTMWEDLAKSPRTPPHVRLFALFCIDILTIVPHACSVERVNKGHGMVHSKARASMNNSNVHKALYVFTNEELLAKLDREAAGTPEVVASFEHFLKTSLSEDDANDIILVIPARPSAGRRHQDGFCLFLRYSYSTQGPLGPLLARSSGRASLFLVICVCLGGCGPLNPFPCSDLTPFL